MERLTAAGLEPLEPLEPASLLDPDPAAEPAGYLVESGDAVRIHFLDWGGVDAVPPPGPAPAVPGFLLVHGLAQTAWAWASVARRLRRVGRVVALDLRGHGLSDAPTHGYDAGQLAADAVAVAEGSGLLSLPGESGGPFVVCGLGYGAIVAAWTAASLAGRCAGLVLVDGGWERLAEVTGASPGEWLAEIEEPPEVLASMAAWLADREAFGPATWDADAERAARSQVVETAAGRLKPAIHPHALAASVGAMWAYQPEVTLPAVEASIAALLAGEDADGSRRAALVEAARRRADGGRAGIRAAALPGLGHDLARHAPGAVAGACLTVLPRP